LTLCDAAAGATPAGALAFAGEEAGPLAFAALAGTSGCALGEQACC